MIREGGTTIRLPDDLRLEARRAADAHGSFNRFVAWTIRQALRLEFLSPGNREFVLNVAGELGQPWDVLAVLNLLVSYARGEARARKLIDLLSARNGFFGACAGHNESQEVSVDQLFIEFPQTASGGGPGVPSPKAIAPDRPMARGGARG